MSESKMLISAFNVHVTMQTQSDNPPNKCMWQVGVISADKESRAKASKSSVSGITGIQSPEFPVADSMSRTHCSL